MFLRSKFKGTKTKFIPFFFPTEDDIPGNLPRVLLCGHIYCTFCLQSLECDSVIRCPECEVKIVFPFSGGHNSVVDSSKFKRITFIIDY